MPRDLATDPLRECVRELANAYTASYDVQGDATWWHFDPVADRPFRRQGWKVHVSASPLTALDTVQLVAGVVMPQAYRWKVARSVRKLIELCRPPSSITQVGKFITVYVDHGEVTDLAAELHEVTTLFDAPVVPTDRRYCRGSNVYMRYGGFSSNATFEGSEQSRKWVLVDSEGRRVEDRRAPGHHAPAWVAEPLPAADLRRRTGPGLFGRDIAVLKVLSQSAKGGVYQVRHDGVLAVMKEARIGTCPDLVGRDSRTALLNEWEILHRLKGTGLAPTPITFFFEEDNAYLIEDHLPGVTLRETVERLNYRGPTDSGTLSALVCGMRDLVRNVRERGVIVSDLTPNNIIIDDGRFSIIDLEHAGLVTSAEPRYFAWTPGYALPANIGTSLDSADTEYAMAAITHFILTGIDPYISPSVSYTEHVDAVLAEFAPRDAVTLLPEVEEVRSTLAGESAPIATPAADEDRTITEAVAAGQELVRRVEWDRGPWPWPDGWSPGSTHPVSFMAGTSGIVQYYLDLWRATGDSEWLRRADELLAWSFDAVPFVVGQTPPGLYFGLGALPWLMVDLVAAGHNAVGWRRRATALALTIEEAGTRTWDITHGWAGVGLALLAVLRGTGDDDCRDGVMRILKRLMNNASYHGDHDLPTWERAGHRYYGFAHGSAGIAYFLLTAGRHIGDAGAVELAVATGHALLAVGTPVTNGQGLSWPDSAESTTIWTHWCNGAAGVGAFLLALASATGDPCFLDGAIRAGRATTRGRPFGSCSRCHGLAGDGDYLLDLAAIPSHREEFLAGAQHIGRKLEALKFDDGFAPKWAHEGDGQPRPGFMRGYTGIHSFRLRLAGHLDRAPLMLSVNSEETSCRSVWRS